MFVESTLMFTQEADEQSVVQPDLKNTNANLETVEDVNTAGTNPDLEEKTNSKRNVSDQLKPQN